MIKKSLVVLLASIVVISVIFSACSTKRNNDNLETTTEGIGSGDDYGTETETVTDEKGKTVTDKDGNKVTTQVNVKYETDKKGKTIAVLIDKEGNPVVDDKGNKVTVKTSNKVTTTATTTGKDTNTKKTTVTTTTNKQQTTNIKAETTTDKSEWTAIDESKDVVPKTSASGKVVSFSEKDLQIIDSMLAVPYSYNCSYENSDLMNISTDFYEVKFTQLATHVAIYMATIENRSGNLASGPVVLDLFKYFGQTVSNFKTNCNSAVKSDSSPAPIKYNSKNDTFDISKSEKPTHSVTITEVQNLGNNNYYKVIGKVSGTSKAKNVVAVVQKNKLHSSLGFSIKAVKWS